METELLPLEKRRQSPRALEESRWGHSVFKREERTNWDWELIDYLSSEERDKWIMPKYTKERRSWVITDAAHKQESLLCECRKGLLCITSWMPVNTAMLSSETDTVLRDITRNIVWQAWNLSATPQERWGPVQASLVKNEKHQRSQNYSFQPPPSRYSPFHHCEFSLTSSLVWLKANFSFVGLLPVCFQLVWLPVLAQGRCRERRGSGAAQSAPSVVMESRHKLHGTFHKNAFMLFLH